MKWTETGFLAFDVETSGLSPDRHRVLEAGLVWIRPDGLVEAGISEFYHWGDGEVDDRALAVNGLRREFLEDLPTFDAAYPELCRFTREAMDAGAVPIAYNAPFDVRFFRAAAIRLSGSALDCPFDLNRCIDPLPLARSVWHTGNRLNEELAPRLGIPVVGAHRAGDDARLVVEVFKKLAVLLDLPEDIEPLLQRQWAAARAWSSRTGRRYA